MNQKPKKICKNENSFGNLCLNVAIWNVKSFLPVSLSGVFKIKLSGGKGI